MEQLYVGIDVSSTKHAAYFMRPNGDKFSSFPMQNDLGAAKMISEKIVEALTNLDRLRFAVMQGTGLGKLRQGLVGLLQLAPGDGNIDLNHFLAGAAAGVRLPVRKL